MKSLIPGLCLITVLSFSQYVFAQKIIFNQDFEFKKNLREPYKELNSYILADSLTKERLIILSGNNDFRFYLTDENWKLKSTFTEPLNKKSGLWNAIFHIIGFNHSGSVWNFTIDYGDKFNSEQVDTKLSTHNITGKVFEDKEPGIINETFKDNGKNYTIYPVKDGGIVISTFNGNEGIKKLTLDVSSQLPLKKSKKFTSKDLFKEFIQLYFDGGNSVYFTKNDVQFYVTPNAYILAVCSQEAVAELMYFDKITGKRLRDDLFSVEDLLTDGARKSKLNTAMLYFDGKFWVYTGDKNNGVLAAFDANTKKLLFSKKFDDNMDVSQFNYGPVAYETSPGGAKFFRGEWSIKEKLNNTTANKYMSELWKGDLGIYIDSLSVNKYAVSLGSYTPIEIGVADYGIMHHSSLSYDFRIYQSYVAGLVFSKDKFELTDTKTNYDEVNSSNVTSKKTVIKEEPRPKVNEYDKDGAKFINQQRISGLDYVSYYYNDQFKIIEEKPETE